MHLFHIVPRAEWEAAAARGIYAPSSLSAEGFIHLSTEGQWMGSARRFFNGQRDLLLLRIDVERVAGEIRWEAADGDRFPHLYGELSPDAVVGMSDIAVGGDGRVVVRARSGDS